MRRILLILVLLVSTVTADAAVKHNAKREKAYRARVVKFVAVQARKQQLASRPTQTVKSRQQN